MSERKEIRKAVAKEIEYVKSLAKFADNITTDEVGLFWTEEGNTAQYSTQYPESLKGNAWRTKAESLIQEMCSAAKSKAKKKTSYSVPVYAQELIECLSEDDEERAKAIFMRLLTIPELKRD